MTEQHTITATNEEVYTEALERNYERTKCAERWAQTCFRSMCIITVIATATLGWWMFTYWLTIDVAFRYAVAGLSFMVILLSIIGCVVLSTALRLSRRASLEDALRLDTRLALEDAIGLMLDERIPELQEHESVVSKCEAVCDEIHQISSRRMKLMRQFKVTLEQSRLPYVLEAAHEECQEAKSMPGVVKRVCTYKKNKEQELGQLSSIIKK